MPCDFQANIEAARRQKALDELEEKLRGGRARVEVNAAGQFTRFADWTKEERLGWCDGCAYRALMRRRSGALAAAMRAAKTTRREVRS